MSKTKTVVLVAAVAAMAACGVVAVMALHVARPAFGGVLLFGLLALSAGEDARGR